MTERDKLKEAIGSDRRIRFCEEWVVSFNGEEAAKKAGYSKNGARVRASELLTNSNIKNYIAYLQNHTSEHLGASKEQNIIDLQKIIKDPETNNRDRIKAIETLNKMLGYNEPDKHDISGNINIAPRTFIETDRDT